MAPMTSARLTLRRCGHLALAALCAVGCLTGGAAGAAWAGQPGRLDFGGLARTYSLHVPPGLEHPAGLVVNLHGAGAIGAGWEWETNYDAVADAHGLIVVYPDGIDFSWADGRGASVPDQQGVDDVGFITGLVAKLVSGIRIVLRIPPTTGSWTFLTTECLAKRPAAPSLPLTQKRLGGIRLQIAAANEFPCLGVNNDGTFRWITVNCGHIMQQRLLIAGRPDYNRPGAGSLLLTQSALGFHACRRLSRSIVLKARMLYAARKVDCLHSALRPGGRRTLHDAFRNALAQYRRLVQHAN